MSMNDRVSSTLSVGDLAPDFTLLDHRGDSLRLSSLRGQPVVVFFYPKAMSPGCTIEACGFRDTHESFVDAGVRVIGVSQDSVEAQARFVARHDLPFTLLADNNGVVRRHWGIGRTAGMLPGRTTFLLDAEGRIVEGFTGQFRPVSHVKRMLAAARTLAATGPAADETTLGSAPGHDRTGGAGSAA